MEPFLICGVNWLVPGAGYWLKGRRVQSIVLFLALNLTILIGVVLHGAIAWPMPAKAGMEINWVNVLTYVGQLGHGAASLVMSGLEYRGLARWYDPSHPWADLAAMYFLVAGAMNYFSTCFL